MKNKSLIFLLISCKLPKKSPDIIPINIPNRNKDLKDKKEELDLKVSKIKNLEELVKFYEEKIKEAKKIGKLIQDPNKFQEYKKKLLEIFCDELKKLNLKEPNNTDLKKKIFVGKISAGKSSILNITFNKNLETGLGETTDKIKEVHSNYKTKIYDSPGFNEEDFNIFSMEVIKELSTFDQIYILYNDSIKTINDIIKIIFAIFDIKDIFFVRTHCDQSKKTDKKTIEEEIDNDIKNLKELGIEIKPEQIFATSAKLSGFDNEKLKKNLVT
jgi:GTP-binding protein EngB required for normal cell division